MILPDSETNIDLLGVAKCFATAANSSATLFRNLGVDPKIDLSSVIDSIKLFCSVSSFGGLLLVIEHDE